jgi:hypothetical protein
MAEGVGFRYAPGLAVPVAHRSPFESQRKQSSLFAPQYRFLKNENFSEFGRGGIRTHGPVARTPVFLRPRTIYFVGKRKRWDSNPRSRCQDSSFQDWCIRPLCHPSLPFSCKLKRIFFKIL